MTLSTSSFFKILPLNTIFIRSAGALFPSRSMGLDWSACREGDVRASAGAEGKEVCFIMSHRPAAGPAPQQKECVCPGRTTRGRARGGAERLGRWGGYSRGRRTHGPVVCARTVLRSATVPSASTVTGTVSPFDSRTFKFTVAMVT